MSSLDDHIIFLIEKKKVVNHKYRNVILLIISKINGRILV